MQLRIISIKYWYNPGPGYCLLIQDYHYLVLHHFDAAQARFSNYTEIDDLYGAAFLTLILGIKKFIVGSTTVVLNNVIYDKNLHRQYYVSLVLGIVTKALDITGQQSKGNIPL